MSASSAIDDKGDGGSAGTSSFDEVEGWSDNEGVGDELRLESMDIGLAGVPLCKGRFGAGVLLDGFGCGRFLGARFVSFFCLSVMN